MRQKGERRGTYRCWNCGRTFAAFSWAAVRACSGACEREYAARTEAARASLRDAGFTRGAAANLWTKDGVAVGEETVVRHGMDVALERHKAAAEGRAAG